MNPHVLNAKPCSIKKITPNSKICYFNSLAYNPKTNFRFKRTSGVNLLPRRWLHLGTVQNAETFNPVPIHMYHTNAAHNNHRHPAPTTTGNGDLVKHISYHINLSQSPLRHCLLIPHKKSCRSCRDTGNTFTRILMIPACRIFFLISLPETS